MTSINMPVDAGTEVGDPFESLRTAQIVVMGGEDAVEEPLGHTTADEHVKYGG